MKLKVQYTVPGDTSFNTDELSEQEVTQIRCKRWVQRGKPRSQFEAYIPSIGWVHFRKQDNRKVLGLPKFEDLQWQPKQDILDGTIQFSEILEV